MTYANVDPCAHCEEMMQPYLDHILSEEERLEAEQHLDTCDWCRRRYRFEESLRVYVRQAVSKDPMSPELKAKLAALRIPLS
jgi:anti-sigma factor RsiW